MTIEEQRARVEEAIRAAGLTRVKDRILDGLAPAFHMISQPASGDIPVGVSRVGGTPDLPPSLAWPKTGERHWEFLAQVNLAELPVGAARADLPARGMLYFFLNEPDFGGTDIWNGVLFSDAPAGELRRAAPPPPLMKSSFFGLLKKNVQCQAFKSCAVKFRETLTLPSWDSLEVEAWSMTDDESEAYTERVHETVMQEMADGTHQVLGHALPIQSDMRTECAINAARRAGVTVNDEYSEATQKRFAPDAALWRLLLEMHEDANAGMTWGDAGSVYFWIRAEDLRNCRFGECQAHVQCH